MQRINFSAVKKADENGSRQTTEYWDKDNLTLTKPRAAVAYYPTGEFARNYTQFFFNRLKLDSFLDAKRVNCILFNKLELDSLLDAKQVNRILDLGCSTGSAIEEYKSQGSEVLGWDFSPVAIKSMQDRNIPCKQINLSAVDSVTGKLSYQEDLETVLATSINIFAVRTLQYLTPEALQLLLLNLINLAPADSTFFLIGNTYPLDEPPIKDRTPQRYFASFFGPRTDFVILHHTVEEGPEVVGGNDEFLVVRKYR